MIRLGSMNRDTQPQTIIPPRVFAAMLNSRVERTKREQAEITKK